jgi:molybdopterin converting factor small subunit
MAATVEVEIIPPLSEIFGKQDRLTIQEKIREGETLVDLFAKMASEDKLFGERVFDTVRRELRIQIVVVVNGRLANFQEGLQTKLHQGCKITLLPLSSGG